MDKAFLTATAIPLMGLVGAIAYKFRPLDWQKGDGKRVSLQSFQQLKGYPELGLLIDHAHSHACAVLMTEAVWSAL